MNEKMSNTRVNAVDARHLKISIVCGNPWHLMIPTVLERPARKVDHVLWFHAVECVALNDL